ncbi:MAG: hypothetical protein WA085_13400 [Sphingobium sp.]
MATSTENKADYWFRQAMGYKADAERYRWLRDNSKDWPREVCDVLENISTAEEWDSTIDAEMQVPNAKVSEGENGK